MARFLIAAAHKSSGKTTVSIGLAAALARSGAKVQPFKKGPDYIDPMWLSRAAGRPCYNLDFNTMDADQICDLFAAKAATADINLIEANKGLYDGVDPEGRDSNAALAKLFDVPVILVISTEGMTRGIAPLVQGYVDFDEGVSIKGVILNKVAGPRHEGKLRAAMERYTDIPVVGAIGRDPALEISERHLGLTTPGEVAVLDTKIDEIAQAVAQSVDVAAIRDIAGSASPFEQADISGTAAGVNPAATSSVIPSKTPSVRIAIARDAAFGFYYPDDLEALERAGAELVPFNCLRDARVPDADAIFVGGGFPETHMSVLAANTSLRADIKRLIEGGLPAYAECGGLMYMSKSLSWQGARHEMVGVIDGDAVMHKRAQGRGYMRLAERSAMPWPQSSTALPADRDASAQPGFGAHEFHYASLDNLSGEFDFAYDVLRGHGVDGRHDGIVIYNLLANFAHLRSTPANAWAERFVSFIKIKQGALPLTPPDTSVRTGPLETLILRGSDDPKPT